MPEQRPEPLYIRIRPDTWRVLDWNDDAAQFVLVGEITRLPGLPPVSMPEVRIDPR